MRPSAAAKRQRAGRLAKALIALSISGPRAAPTELSGDGRRFTADDRSPV